MCRPDFNVLELLGSNRVPPQDLAAYARTKNADWLDVTASMDRPGTGRQRPKNESYESAVVAPSTHSGSKE